MPISAGVRWGTCVLGVSLALGLPFMAPRLAARLQSRPAADMRERWGAQLCAGWDQPGSPRVVAGSRVRWSRASSATAPLGAAATAVQFTSTVPNFSAAGEGQWVVFQAGTPLSSYRRDCANAEQEILPFPDIPLQLAVSVAGDVAALAAGGDIYVVSGAERWERGAPSSESTRRLMFQPKSDIPAHIAWRGRKLLAVGTGYITLMGVSRGVFAVEMSQPIPSRGGKARQILTFAGLLYVTRELCVDVYPSDDLNLVVRSTTCGPNIGAPAAYMTADANTLQFVSPSQAVRTVPRPKIAIAEARGTTREIAQAVVPLARESSRALLGNGQVLAADARGETLWRGWLPEQAWAAPVRERQQAGIKAIIDSRWGNLTKEGAWWLGDGLALTWKTVSDFVLLKGRSLAALGMELTPGGSFSDSQVLQIVRQNRHLARTLEGELIARGWTPIAVPLRVPGYPVSFRSRQLLETDLDQSGANLLFRNALRGCNDSTAREDLALGKALAVGLTLAGQTDVRSDEALQASASATLRGASVQIVECAVGAGTAAPLHLLVVNGAIVTLEPAGLAPVMRPSIPGVAADDFDRVRGGWRVSVANPVVVGVMGGTHVGVVEPPQGIREWLEAALPAQANLKELLVPVPAFHVAVLGDATELADELEQIRNLTVVSAESIASTARAPQPCAPDRARLNRAAANRLVQLDGFDLAQVELGAAVPLAIAENEIALFREEFSRDANQPLWVFPIEAQGLQPVRPENTRPVVNRRDLTHGTQVASLIAAARPLPGLLPNVRLVWLDLTLPVNSHLEPLRALAGSGVVVNVSQKLAETWNALEGRIASQEWSQSTLFIAAAKNINEREWGAPLSWRRARANVIGVGIVDASGEIPDGTDYSFDYVDLLAPGDIASTDHEGRVVCDSGTSFATAYASVAAAVLADELKNTEFISSRLRARLLATATWKTSFGKRVRGGILNARAAVKHLRENILTIRGPVVDDEETEDTYVVKMPEALGSGVKFIGTPGRGEPERNVRADWFNILRIQYVRTVDTRPVFRISIVDSATASYEVFDDAVFLDDTAMPIEKCSLQKDPDVAASCAGTTVNQIVDYVRRYPARLAITSF